MKIGILTFHNADNYGAVLQCYALQEHLKKLYPNDKVFVINYKNSAIEKSYRSILFRKKLLSNITQFLYLPRVLKKRNSFRKFRLKYLNLGIPHLSTYDLIYFGSDQIWNGHLTNNDMIFFGKNYEGRKIAYAASDGNELIFNEEIHKYLSCFESITCREETLKNKLLEQEISVPIKVVTDPVFLLSKEQWLKIAEKPIEKGYVLAYKIADRPDFDLQAELLGEKLGKQVIQIVYIKTLRKLFYKKQKIVEGISPTQFLGYFANADYIITTSYHGTAFSILFEKPFYVLQFEKRNERVTDLLKDKGLYSQYIHIIPETVSYK